MLGSEVEVMSSSIALPSSHFALKLLKERRPQWIPTWCILFPRRRCVPLCLWKADDACFVAWLLSPQTPKDGGRVHVKVTTPRRFAPATPGLAPAGAVGILDPPTLPLRLYAGCGPGTGLVRARLGAADTRLNQL